MGLLARLLGPRRDDHAEVRPLWHAIVAQARDPAWYRAGGLADSVAGRFDAITLVLGLVLLRMERDEALRQRTARLTELFVRDMDGQLREIGVGDLVVGKRMGKLMSAFGGRLDAWRTALAGNDPLALEQALTRNLTLRDGASPADTAALVRALQARLAARDQAALLAGHIAP